MLKSAHIFNYAMMYAMPQHHVPIRLMLMSIMFRHYIQLREVKRALEAKGEE